METELSQEHRGLPALAQQRTPSSDYRQCTGEDLHYFKANIFQALDNLMVELVSPLPSGLVHCDLSSSLGAGRTARLGNFLRKEL